MNEYFDEDLKFEEMQNYIIEVELEDPDDFLIVKETLTRMGVASMRTKTLYQSCHILHKRGKYYIVHFKNLFELDGKTSNFSEDDKNRLNLIATLLEDWGLVKIVHPERITTRATIKDIKIVSHREKADWNLEAKYTFGSRKHD